MLPEGPNPREGLQEENIEEAHLVDFDNEKHGQAERSSSNAYDEDEGEEPRVQCGHQ